MPTNDLSLAIKLLNQGEFSKVEEICVEALRVTPENAKAWHLCGIAHAQRGSMDSAVECFENAVKHAPSNANFHYNLGLAYRSTDQLDHAISSYRDAIALDSKLIEARNNLGNALMDQGENREAIQCFRDLIEETPSSDAHYNLANLLQDTGNFDESIEHYKLALELDPESSSARENLGRALTDAGRVEDATQVWQDWLACDPHNAVARHLLASTSGENVPVRCDDECVRQTFNESFARTFDSQLARLEYRAPELIGDALKSIGHHDSDLEVLDAGCGTGLCGPIIRPLASKLVGVDLSEDMLIEARKRNTYDETIAREITEYMEANPRSFDLIVSSDTLCYFGDLDRVLGAAFGCLRESGVFAFTVELCDDDAIEQYKIHPSGRYRHLQGYVTESLERIGFCVSAPTQATLRMEQGLPVEGLVFTATRSRA